MKKHTSFREMASGLMGLCLVTLSVSAAVFSDLAKANGGIPECPSSFTKDECYARSLLRYEAPEREFAKAQFDLVRQDAVVGLIAKNQLGKPIRSIGTVPAPFSGYVVPAQKQEILMAFADGRECEIVVLVVAPPGMNSGAGALRWYQAEADGTCHNPTGAVVALKSSVSTATQPIRAKIGQQLTGIKVD